MPAQHDVLNRRFLYDGCSFLFLFLQHEPMVRVEECMTLQKGTPDKWMSDVPF